MIFFKILTWFFKLLRVNFIGIHFHFLKVVWPGSTSLCSNILFIHHISTVIFCPGYTHLIIWATFIDILILHMVKCPKNLSVLSITISSVQSLSSVWLFVTPWIVARQASLSITNSRSSLKVTSIELVMPSSHLILCRPFFLLLPIPPSIKVLSNESTLRMRWPKYWSFSFSIIPSKEQPGLISFRMDWLVLLAVYGTLKSLLQHHSSKASILRCSAFFTVQLSHPYMTTGKP